MPARFLLSIYMCDRERAPCWEIPIIGMTSGRGCFNCYFYVCLRRRCQILKGHDEYLSVELLIGTVICGARSAHERENSSDYF